MSKLVQGKARVTAWDPIVGAKEGSLIVEEATWGVASAAKSSCDL